MQREVKVALDDAARQAQALGPGAIPGKLHSLFVCVACATYSMHGAANNP
jgi:hypothetical protein